MSARITDRPATAAQIRAIHAAAGRLGLADAEYRALLADWGVSTSKDLSRRQASDLLARLGRPLARPPGDRPKPATRRRIANPAEKPPSGDGDGVIRLATNRQRALIRDLAAEIAWETEDGFRRWLARSLGIDRVRTGADASRAIQGLRGLKAHGHGRPAARE